MYFHCICCQWWVFYFIHIHILFSIIAFPTVFLFFYNFLHFLLDSKMIRFKHGNIVLQSKSYLKDFNGTFIHFFPKNCFMLINFTSVVKFLNTIKNTTKFWTWSNNFIKASILQLIGLGLNGSVVKNKNWVNIIHANFCYFIYPYYFNTTQ